MSYRKRIREPILRKIRREPLVIDTETSSSEEDDDDPTVETRTTVIPPPRLNFYMKINVFAPSNICNTTRLLSFSHTIDNTKWSQAYDTCYVKNAINDVINRGTSVVDTKKVLLLSYDDGRPLPNGETKTNNNSIWYVGNGTNYRITFIGKKVNGLSDLALSIGVSERKLKDFMGITYDEDWSVGGDGEQTWSLAFTPVNRDFFCFFVFDYMNRRFVCWNDFYWRARIACALMT